MTTKFDITDIMDMLPHRYPFLLIDRVVELSDDLNRVVVIKNVTVNEPQFTGHFPQVPVMPGVLIIEAMAQACAIMALARLPEDVDRKNSLFYFAGIDNARFKRGVKLPLGSSKNVGAIIISGSNSRYAADYMAKALRSLFEALGCSLSARYYIPNTDLGMYTFNLVELERFIHQIKAAENDL